MKRAIAQSQASTSSTPANTSEVDNFENNVISLYGWRKKCLYLLMLVIILLVGVNLGLTLWVMKVMEFSSNGMGQIKIVPGGLKLDGKAYILGNLIVSTIRSRAGQPITFESSNNFTFRSRNEKGRPNSWLKLSDSHFECMTDNFKIFDEKGRVLFSATKDAVEIGSESLRVENDAGTMFRKAVETPLVRAPPGHDLRLTSPTRQMAILGTRGIKMEALGGKISAIAFDNMTFVSEVGAVKVESSIIIMPKLPTAKVSKNRNLKKNTNIFQLCACGNGKLFLSPSYSICASTDEKFCDTTNKYPTYKP